MPRRAELVSPPDKSIEAIRGQLDELNEKVKSLETSDPQKAQALRQEVLSCARQNLTDIQTHQAVCVNGYLSLDVLKKTGREMINGCTRVATTGMSALAVAQTVARATGNQIRVMEMLRDEGVRLPGTRREALRLENLAGGLDVNDAQLRARRAA